MDVSNPDDKEGSATDGVSMFVIESSNGQLLQAISIEKSIIHVGWFDPMARGKTSKGQQGPITFADEGKARALLSALVEIFPSQFLEAIVSIYQASE